MDRTESPRSKYRLIVVELDDVVPRRDVDKPNLYVTKTSSQVDIRFEQLRRTKRRAWYAGHIKKLRSDLCPNSTFNDSEMASEACRALIQKLSSDGYTVNRNTRVWSVYVIELDSSAVTNPGNGYVYVGETSLDPEVRFHQHITGARNGKGRLYAGVVKNHGRKLRPDLAPKTKYYDSAAAKRAEREHFEFLKSKGFNVKGGH